ncbi:hypothetical protein QFC22_001444 [Naganishia vaughanmartiniae]|uniref:Uncharacterized protein n=1 Tax=Naganishia vaughanmartiniae TaxID=1424756 RepID=A0ACC2XGU4_9TREE|nr:hypothetical protein QFC22_001444 [Naganishia vaughanmartiniae]
MFNNDKMEAVRKLKQALPVDLFETCAARQRVFSNEPAMDQDMKGDAESNDARIEENVIELKFHMALHKTLEALDEAEDKWDVGPADLLPGSLFSEQAVWALERAPVIDIAYGAVIGLLRDSGWTSFSPSMIDHARNRGFDDVRKWFTGDLIIRLHRLLMMSSSYLKSNLQRAISLPVIVADEDSGIYQQMLSTEEATKATPLEVYLQMVKDAALESLHLRNADFWDIREE